VTTTGTGYVLDNHHEVAEVHHQALTQLFNGFTFERILGLVDLPGARVMDVGAGNGSVARWLADEVGDRGHVTAVDIKPMITHRQVGVVQQDLTALGDDDWPWPMAGPWSLIHARMTLHHLPNREALLAGLIARLAPGGVLLVQDLAASDRGMVVAAPDPWSAELYERYQRIKTSVFEAGGSDRRWAARLHQTFREHGLVDIETVIHSGYWVAGGPGLLLERAVLEQLTPQLRQRGMSEAEFDRVRQLLDDPQLVVRGHPLYSTAGRMPNVGG
jgi:SAM-dependent methyltransferase